MVEFAKLESVELRRAWPREDRDFTPWLAENLDRISEVIGIPLELEKTEASVERYFADIHALDSQSGTSVVIENQLEWSNHGHLGQLLTYLAGLNAEVIIWIAEDFTNPHLSAIRWLNDHTFEPFAFFAVRVRVVRIADSPLVPIFEVLERPNEWDRRVRASQESSGELTGMSKLRHDFWAEYTASYPEDGHIRSTYKGANIYRRIEGVVVSLYIAQGGTGIYIRDNDNRYTEEERQFAQLCIDAVKDNGIAVWKDFDIVDAANWPEMAIWLHDRYRQFKETIEFLAAEPASESGPAGS